MWTLPAVRVYHHVTCVLSSAIVLKCNLLISRMQTKLVAGAITSAALKPSGACLHMFLAPLSLFVHAPRVLLTCVCGVCVCVCLSVCLC